MPKIGQRPVHIGCSGWNYASWKDEFYEGKPPRLWLQHYARFFDTYGSRGRDGNYSERELEEWARRFETWRRDTAIYAYFDNDWEMFALRNARWLKRRLSS